MIMIWGCAWEEISGAWLAAACNPSPLCGSRCCWWSGSQGVLLRGAALRTAHPTPAWLRLRRERFPSLKSASIHDWSCIRLPWLDTRSPSGSLIACSLLFSEVILLSVLLIQLFVQLLSKAWSQTSCALGQHSCLQNFVVLCCSLWALQLCWCNCLCSHAVSWISAIIWLINLKERTAWIRGLLQFFVKPTFHSSGLQCCFANSTIAGIVNSSEGEERNGDGEELLETCSWHVGGGGGGKTLKLKLLLVEE